MSQLFIQQNNQQNGIATMQNMLVLLKVPATPNAVADFLNTHPDYPSLKSLSDGFKYWGVDHLAVQLAASDLEEVSWPAIVSVQKADEVHFWIVEGIEHEQVKVLDPAKGRYTLPLPQFLQQWKGDVLMAEAMYAAGQSDYEAQKKQAALQKWRPGVMGLLIGLMVLSLLPALTSSPQLTWLLTWVLKVMGTLVTIALVATEVNQAGTLIKKICGVNEKQNCQAVLSTKASKLTSWLSFAELGLFYFAGGSIALSIGALFGQANIIVSLLGYFSLLALPYTLFSTYYQWRVVKQWCPLCLAVQALFWLEALCWYLWHFDPNTAYPLATLGLLLFSFALPVLVWVFAKPYLLKAQHAPALQKQLKIYTFDGKLLAWQLFSQNPIATAPLPAELALGQANAPVQITVVSSPTCQPCAQMHPDLHILAKRYPEEVNIKVRLLGHAGILASIFSYALDGKPATGLATLEEVYQMVAKDGNTPTKLKMARAGTDKAFYAQVQAAIEAHAQWAAAANIEATPTILVNGYPLPGHYTLKHLMWHMEEIVASLENSQE